MKLFETLYKYRQIILILIYLYILLNYVKPNDYITMMLLTATTALILCKTTKNQIEGVVNSNMQNTSNELKQVLRGEQPTEAGVPISGESISSSTVNAEDGTIDKNDSDNPQDYKKDSEQIIKDARSGELKDEPKGVGKEIPEIEGPKGDPINKDVKLVQLKDVYKIGPFDGVCLNSIVKKKEHETIPNEELDVYQGVQGPIQSVKTQENALTGPTIDGDKDSVQKMAMFGNNKGNNECCDESPYMARGVGCVCLTEKQKRFIGTRGFNTAETGF
tara:strand:- start:8966 stop:9790 length:825 start_codon:yes stop_codon:yes gene_type:complete